MEIKKTKIIILNHFKIRENSQILNCFSRDFGKIDLNISSKGMKATVNLMDIFSEQKYPFYIYLQKEFQPFQTVMT